MRQVKRMLADEDYLNEIARQRRLAAPSGAVIDETLIETIMVQIPVESKYSQNSVNTEKKTSKGDVQNKSKKGSCTKIQLVR